MSVRAAWVSVFVVLVGLPGMGRAQTVPEDAMEVQRCVWSCERNTGGVGTDAYQACVTETCGEAPAASSKAAVWRVEEVEDGRGLAAVADDPNMGTALWVICGPAGGERTIEIRGAEGPDATLQLNIDGTAVFPLLFKDMGGRGRAGLAPPFAEIAALKAGSSVALLNDAGYSVFSASLAGSSAALDAACGDLAAAPPAEAATDPAKVAADDGPAPQADPSPETAAGSGLNPAYAGLTSDMAAEQCVTACLRLTPGAASPEFGACTARNCGPDRTLSFVASADDPATTTNAPEAGPQSPMPWQAADIPACIASCEVLTPGVRSIEYQSCVLEHCDIDHGFSDGPDLARSVTSEVPEIDFVVPSPPWTLRTSDDGKARIAAVTDPNSGNEFSVWCPVDGGPASFAVRGPRSPTTTLGLAMLELPFLLKFQPDGAYLRATLPPGGLEIEALAKTDEFSLALTAGYTLIWITMNGADKALAEACP